MLVFTPVKAVLWAAMFVVSLLAALPLLTETG